MNPKKFLQILEILCPVFTKVEDKNGNPDKTTPCGYAVWFAARVCGLFKAVWDDNEIMSATDKLIMFFVRIFISILVFPFALLMWTIGNLIFSIRYDKRKNNKTHLFLMYSFVVILFITLGVLLVDYHCNGEITEQINSSISESAEEIQNIQRRSAPRQATKKETITHSINLNNPEYKLESFESESDNINSFAEDYGYTLQRTKR